MKTLILDGSAVQRIRKQKNWSPRDLAYRADISENYVRRLERHHSVVTTQTLGNFMQALKVTNPGDIVRWERK